MSVVVTGAAGFLGRAAVAALLARGEHVVAVDRSPLEPAAGVQALRCDISADSAPLAQALADADAVLHLAARSGVRDAHPDIAALRARDTVGTADVVLRRTPLRTPLVVASSSSVYGGSSGRPCAERDVLNPVGGYAESKVAVEALCQERVARGGTVVVARPFTVLGEGQRADMAVSRWLRAVATGAQVTVLGDLTRTRDVTDVRDAVRVLLALLDRGGVDVVNVGTGRGRTLGELIGAVQTVLDLPADVRVQPAAAAEVPATLADIRHCADVVGFVPETDLLAVITRQARVEGLLPRPTAPVQQALGAQRIRRYEPAATT